MYAFSWDGIGWIRTEVFLVRVHKTLEFNIEIYWTIKFFHRYKPHLPPPLQQEEVGNNCNLMPSLISKLLPMYLLSYMLWSRHIIFDAKCTVAYQNKRAVNVNNLRLSDIFIKTWSTALMVKYCRDLALCWRCRRQMTYDINRTCWHYTFTNIHLSESTMICFICLWSQKHCRQIDFQHDFIV